MSTKKLTAVGIGDVPVWLADEGLALALTFFEEKNLDPAICYEAKTSNSHNELAACWDDAERMANQVLLGSSRYEYSIIALKFEED